MTSFVLRRVFALALIAVATAGMNAGPAWAQDNERPVGLFSLDGHPHLKLFAIDPPDLGAYRALTQIGA